MAAKHRLSRITTRTGDGGNTKLATGRSIGKHDVLIRAIGAVDELNSHIGVLTATTEETLLKQIQQSLFDMGAVFAMEGSYDPPGTGELEDATAELNKQLPPLTEFVLPGGGGVAAQCHVCRSVCRRAETDVWAMLHTMDDPPSAYLAAARYLNRLSDYFFVLARTLTATVEEQWRGPNPDNVSG